MKQKVHKAPWTKAFPNTGINFLFYRLSDAKKLFTLHDCFEVFEWVFWYFISYKIL